MYECVITLKPKEWHEKTYVRLLLTKLITHIRGEEPNKIAKTCKQMKSSGLKDDSEFMKKLERGFSKKDIPYLIKVKEKYQP